MDDPSALVRFNFIMRFPRIIAIKVQASNG